MELLVTKDRLGALRPADEMSEEAIRNLGPGEIYKITLTRPRNAKFHRLFFALLSVVFRNLPEHMEKRFPTRERLRKELLIQTGRFDLSETLGGKILIEPHSMSFASMEEDEFERFFADAMHVIRRHIIPGIDETELREAIDNEISRYG